LLPERKIHDRKYRKDYAIAGEVLPYTQFKKQLLHSDLLVQQSVQKKFGSANYRCWAIDFVALSGRCDVSGFETTDITPLN